MSAAEPHFSLRKLKDHAETLFELAHEYGEGEANPFRFSDWERFCGRNRQAKTVRRHWDRARLAWKAMQFEIEDRQDGKEVELILACGTGARAGKVLASLNQDLAREDFVATEFRSIRLEEIEVDEQVEVDPTRLEQMQESIKACSLGVIHPVVVVGLVPPYRLGLGRVRLEACRALELPTILARVVTTWDELAGIDENLVRGYSHQEQERLRERREALIAKRRAEGRSDAWISQELGVPRTTVRRSGWPHGHPERVVGTDGKLHPGRRTTPEELRRRQQRARELKQENPKITTAEVAEALGVSQGTAHKTLKAIEEDIAAEEVVPFEVEYEIPERPRQRWVRVIEDVEWDEIDPDTEPVFSCLAAVNEGLATLVKQAAGTDMAQTVQSLREIWWGIERRVRAGRFEYEDEWAA